MQAVTPTTTSARPSHVFASPARYYGCRYNLTCHLSFRAQSCARTCIELLILPTTTCYKLHAAGIIEQVLWLRLTFEGRSSEIPTSRAIRGFVGCSKSVKRLAHRKLSIHKTLKHHEISTSTMLAEHASGNNSMIHVPTRCATELRLCVSEVQGG